jgi:flavin reductase (DIM6/NTAB) family NADH-FMN oxidoreductase RutF
MQAPLDRCTVPSATDGRPEPTDMRRVLSAFPTGVTAVAALVDGRPAGLAANSFTSVSLEPPMVLICIAHTSTTWPVLHTAPRLGISVLGAHQEQHGRALSARDIDRFEALDWQVSDGGAVLIEGASAWLNCSIERQISAGDHDVVLLRVHALDADASIPPLVFHASRYRALGEPRSAALVQTPSEP